MTNTIYKQHDAAFAQVQAWVLLNNAGEKTATISFKFPRDGAGRLSCYFHIHGLPMVKGNAGGYGYDKRSAAFHDAARKCAVVKLQEWQKQEDYIAEYELAARILATVDAAGGQSWNDALRVAGFNLIQAL